MKNILVIVILAVGLFCSPMLVGDAWADEEESREGTITRFVLSSSLVMVSNKCDGIMSALRGPIEIGCVLKYKTLVEFEDAPNMVFKGIDTKLVKCRRNTITLDSDGEIVKVVVDMSSEKPEWCH